MEKEEHSQRWSQNSLINVGGEMKIDSYLALYTEINSLQIRDLNTKIKTTKPLEENMAPL